MSSEVEDRIVSIQFDNASFERKLEQTLASLDKLSESLRFSNAGKGIQNVSNAVNSFNPSGMEGAIDHIASKFSAMGAIGFSVINNLTTGALNFVRKIGGDILNPILTGGFSRAKNLEQAKFLFEGIGIDVQKGMDSALKAVKGTAFGLDEAAKSAAQFGASGIKVGEQMTSALRGVAGVAALTGRSFSEIGDIFASSAATGVVNNQDLQQFATRGLNAAAALAKQMGITEAQVHELASQGKIDFKTFAADMDKAFGAHATEANKTYTGSLANLHAAFSRLGASFISPHLEQQRDLFNALTPVIDNVAAALLPLINDFVVLKRISIDNVIKFLNKLDVASFKIGVGNLAIGFVNLYHALKPIGLAFKSAFKEIFSGSAGKTFISLTNSFKNFTAGIKIGVKTLQNIKSIFKGFFAVVEIGFTIFKEVIKTVGAIIQALFPASKGFLTLGASTGDFLTNLNKALVAGGGITRFFDKLRDVILHPVEAFSKLTNAISDFFHGINFASSGPLKALQDLRDKLFNFFHIKPGGAAEAALGRLGQRMQQVHTIWNKVEAAFTKVHDFLKPILDYMVGWVKSLGNKIAAAFHPGDFNALLDLINVGLLGGIVVILKKFAQNGLKLDLTGGFLQKLRDAFNQLTNTLKTMQTELKAQALEKIAIAIAILTGSLVVLSLIDSKKLTKALVALSISFAQLIGAMTLIDKINISASIVKLNGIAAAMILIAGAAVVLSIAVTILSKVKFSQLIKGLAGVGVGLGLLVLATKSIAGSAPQLLAAGLAMIAMSAALIILSEAVKLFGKLSMGSLAKGLVGIGVGLSAVVTAMNFIPPETVLSGLGFIEVAAGLSLLAGAVKLFSLLSAGDIAKGIVSIAAALVLIAGAMQLMPIDLPITAAGVLVLSVALGIMAKAVQLMGKNDFGTLAKGIGAIAATLLILALAVNAMDGAIVGAAAIFVVSTSLGVLAEVVKKFAGIKLGDLAKGLLAIAATLTVLGVAAFLLTPVIPEILAMGVALAVVGGAFVLFGTGAILVSKGFQIMAESGAAGAKAIVQAIGILVTAIPTIEKAAFTLVVGFLKDVLRAAPLLARLIGALITQLLDTIIHLAPKFGKMVSVLIDTWVKFVKKDSGKLIASGLELLLNFLKGIRDNIGEITNVVSDIIINFINALSKRVGDVADAVRHFIIIVFITAVERLTGIDLILGPAGRKFIGGLLKGIIDKAKDVYDWFKNLPGKILGFVKRGLGINSPSSAFIRIGVNIMEGLLVGLIQKVGDVSRWLIQLPGRIIAWVGPMSRTLYNKGTDIVKGLFAGILDRITGVANWFRNLPGHLINWIPNMLGVLVNVGHDIIVGLWNGIWDKAVNWLQKKFKDLVGLIPKWARDLLGIKSPSKVFTDIGKHVISGLGAGISKGLSILSPSKMFAQLGKAIPEGLMVGVRSMDQKVRTSTLDLSKKLLNSFDGNSVIKSWKSSFDNDHSLSNSLVNLSTRATEKFSTSIDKVKAVVAKIGHFEPKVIPNLDLTQFKADSSNISSALTTALTIPPDTRKNVLDISDQVTKKFNEAMKRISLANIDNFNPEITPVVNLEKVKAMSSRIAKIVPEKLTIPIDSDGSAKRFIDISDRVSKKFNKSMSTIPKALSGLSNFNPMITPSLDLGKIKTDSLSIAGIMSKSLDGLGSSLNVDNISKTFNTIGENLVGSLVLPISNDKSTEQSVINLSDRVTQRFNEIMNRIPEAISGIDAFSPTITPVLDLSKVKSGASGIAELMKSPALTPDVSITKANDISKTSKSTAEMTPPAQPPTTNINFEQNNFSPKALSTNDIYRNTNSQIKLAKEKLDIK